MTVGLSNNYTNKKKQNNIEVNVVYLLMMMSEGDVPEAKLLWNIEAHK